tara:strand:+ start:1546 stop:2517 length:972 start_codon:yes stop_codon:yes gene_type:complete
MSTYKTINGGTIQSVASDPPASYIGQVWYNSTSGTLKFNAGPQVGTWATKANMNFSRAYLGGCGTTTSALGFGGEGKGPSPSARTGATEAYNGTAWTTGNAIPSIIADLAGAGVSSTSGLTVGGSGPSGPLGGFTWNGSWTASPNLNTGRHALGGSGTVTAALAYGGFTSPTASETYNGSAWTNTPSLNTGGYRMGGAGPNTSAFAFGGNFSNNSEKYNGSAWTTGPTLNVARGEIAGAGTSNTASLAMGGSEPPNRDTTELFNGTAWVSQANMIIGKNGAGGAGIETLALTFGGIPGPGTTPSFAGTEEFSMSGGVRTITTS